MSRQETLETISRFSQFDIDEDDDIEIALSVIASFGNVRRDSDSHLRSVRVLHACLLRYLWTWVGLGCEPPGPATACETVTTWLSTGEFNDMADTCFPVTPMRDGHPVEDCNEPALNDLSGACARLVYYCKRKIQSTPQSSSLIYFGQTPKGFRLKTVLNSLNGCPRLA